MSCLVDSHTDQIADSTLMNTATILRDLWRLRLFVAGVCLLAVIAGAAVLFRISFPPKSRSYDVGIATARILVDTPGSQVVTVAPKGSALLGYQANLLASLMVDGAIKSDIAQRTGVPPNEIVGVTDAATEPTTSGPTPVSAPTGPHRYALTTQILTDSAGDDLPIIELDAQAPSRAEAANLANAAIAGLGDYIDSTAALERVPDANRLQLTSLGMHASTVAQGPSVLIAIAAFVLVAGLGCGGILAVLAVVRAWRAVSPGEHLDRDELDELLVWDAGPSPDEYFLESVGAGQSDRGLPGTGTTDVALASAERRSSSGGNGSHDDGSHGNGSNGNGFSDESIRSDEPVPASSEQELA